MQSNFLFLKDRFPVLWNFGTLAEEYCFKDSSFDLLQDKDGLNLRSYQVKAIQAAENAISQGQRNVLLVMATGTGKTRTAIGMIYRFLKAGRFRRSLDSAFLPAIKMGMTERRT